MHQPSYDQVHLSLSDIESWAALATGALLFTAGLRRGRAAGIGMAAAATPLLYRGITGRWPMALPGGAADDDTRVALGGARGVHVRESVQIELPVADVYRFWRKLDNLPRFMDHLESVREDAGTGRSRWVAHGPGRVYAEWEAVIINDVENETIGWKSLPGSDIVSAGSVNFKPLSGTSTEVRVHLQYAPPAGKAGAFLASLFGQEPGQVIGADLRRLKTLLESGAGAGPAPSDLPIGDQ